MRVTEIIPQKKGKVKVCLDDGSSFSLYQREVTSYGLKEETDISDSDWKQLREEIFDLRAKKRAMHLLERMSRTESQLRQKLTGNGYPPESVEVAIAYVKSYHYIDDRRYAESYIRFHQQQKSRMQLKISLQQKGVSTDIIDEAMEEAYEGNEEELIRKLLAKKHYNAEEMDRQEKHKIYQFLMRRGFSVSAIRRCMDLY